MKTMQDLVHQLKLFSPEIIELQPPVSDLEIVQVEKRFGFRLPYDYKTFLKAHNGLILMGVTIYGIDQLGATCSIEKCFQFEHYEVDNPMPEYLVPFSPDGGGNHYCFDLRTYNSESCEIVFWQHDFIYDDKNKPEVVNPSFANWVEEVVINWTLEDYDYSGNRRP